MLRMSSAKRTIIYLFRNDLRVHDNECLKWAQEMGDYVIPLYCFQPDHFKGTHHFNFPRCGIHRTNFLFQTVEDLRKNLQKLGSNLVVRHQCATDAVSDLLDLCSTSVAPVHSLVLQREFATEETDQENQLEKLCAQHNVQLKAIWGLSLFHKDDIPYTKKDIPDTYTKFRQGVESKSTVRSLIPTPSRLNPLPPIQGAKLGDIPKFTDLGFKDNDVKIDSRSAVPFTGGESAGCQRLKSYLWETDAIATYKETRNGLVGENYSTKFSVWLANGSLSPRLIYHEVKEYEEKKVSNDSTYWCIFELIWRDYFKFVNWKYGRKIFFLSGIMGKRLPWKQDMSLFEKWSKGETGVPFVDANMRELLQTGWMSNRGRQNVASFLVKDLKLDWRLGAEWFEAFLLDHDVCSNYGNWNYSAGIGNDPRQDRKFNMIKQGLDYDANGEFVKTWIPELKEIPQSKVHVPWTIPEKELQKISFCLGRDYPHPVVVAPEWARHTHKTGAKTREESWTKPQRGIDFYFKSSGGKK